MIPDPSRLSSLLASRICHDLINPIGAIGNGLELLVMSGTAGGGPELALIQDSLLQANARLRFFRIAFGLTRQEQAIGRDEILSILSDITAGSRLTVEWHIPAQLPRNEAKLAFLVILCLETMLPQGGRIRLNRQDGAWSLQAESLRLRHVPALWQVVQDRETAAEVEPGQVQFLILREEAEAQGRALRITAQPDAVEISF